MCCVTWTGSFPAYRFRMVDEQDPARPHMRVFLDERMNCGIRLMVLDATVLHGAGAERGGKRIWRKKGSASLARHWTSRGFTAGSSSASGWSVETAWTGVVREALRCPQKPDPSPIGGYFCLTIVEEFLFVPRSWPRGGTKWTSTRN